MRDAFSPPRSPPVLAPTLPSRSRPHASLPFSSPRSAWGRNGGDALRPKKGRRRDPSRPRTARRPPALGLPRGARRGASKTSRSHAERGNEEWGERGNEEWGPSSPPSPDALTSAHKPHGVTPVASAASRRTLSECCGLTQLWLLAERERDVTPSPAQHLLPGEARHACIQGGVEPPHSTIRHDLWVKVSPSGEAPAARRAVRAAVAMEALTPALSRRTRVVSGGWQGRGNA